MADDVRSQNGRDPYLEKLDTLIEGQEVLGDLLEEIIAKLDDFEVENSGYDVEDV